MKHVPHYCQFHPLDAECYTCYYTCNIQGGDNNAKETHGDHKRRSL